MLSKSRRITVALVSVALTCADTSRADVNLVQLQATNLSVEVAHWRELGVTAGDVLLRNRYLTVVVRTLKDGQPKSHAGTAVVLGKAHSSDVTAIRFEPGPRDFWGRAVGGVNEHVAVVRFVQPQQGWRAELSYELRSDRSWLDVVTRVRNTQKEKTLRIPMMDTVAAVGEATIEARDDHTILMQDAKTGQTAMFVPADVNVDVFDVKKNRWVLAFVVGDEQPSLFRRVGRRLRHLGRDDEWTPISLPREWSRRIRDHKHWIKIGPGEERILHRKLVSSMDSARTMQLARFAMNDLGHLPPGPKSLPGSSKTVVNSLGKVEREGYQSAKPRVMGQLRIDSRESLESTPINTEPRILAVPEGFVPALPKSDDGPGIDAHAPNVNVAQESTPTPLSSPQTQFPSLIEEIGSLPPPIDE